MALACRPLEWRVMRRPRGTTTAFPSIRAVWPPPPGPTAAQWRPLLASGMLCHRLVSVERDRRLETAKLDALAADRTGRDDRRRPHNSVAGQRRRVHQGRPGAV
jgi:hypothetical protein